MRILTAALLSVVVHGCSNLLVSPEASASGAAILAYNSDDMGLFGSIDHRPATFNNPPGTRRAVFDWDDQLFTGYIPEVTNTYNVVGNCNEHGLCITETTFGGLSSLDGHGTGAIMSYGDLIFTTLTRAKTAREAIAVMANLCDLYGYESNGESFGVGDGTEVWLMELVGVGVWRNVSKGKGAHWVASKVPAGYVGSTANQARTRTFAQNSPDVIFSEGIVEFAQAIGAYPASGAAADFDFTAAFDPISFGGARFGEARVWNILNPACGGCLTGHLDFAQGYNLSNPMPLFVPVARKLTLNASFELMRTAFEGTWFDNTGTTRPDVGAQSGNSPYRFRPLVWTSGAHQYLNERTVAVQQSGWAFVAEIRGWMPPPFRAVEHFAPDDSGTSPRVPVYGGATRIPAAFGSRVGQTPGGGVPYAPIADGYVMNLDSAFWIWNLVGNIAFSEHYADVRPLIRNEVEQVQALLFNATARNDADVLSLWATDEAAAIEYATAFGERMGSELMTTWTQVWMKIFSFTRDGGLLLPPDGPPVCVPPQVTNCVAKQTPVDSERGYSEAWRARIVADSDNAVRYRVPDGAFDSESAKAKLAVMSGKRRTTGRRA